ncbi:MAG: glycosyltransferase family 4 protein [Deltaproteobacteria bacterium]|nr:glycosyltransferase family 4 protein [Deltaproteobacteria bacterium]
MKPPTQQPTLGYILKGYPRISETFISNEILLLEGMGFKLRLFPMRLPRESFSHDSVKKISAQVDYLPSELFLDFSRLVTPNIFLAVKQPGAYLKAIKYAAENLQKRGKTATLKHLLQAGYLTNNLLLKDRTIVHLHGHFAHSPTSVTLFASLLSGIPFSFTAHAKDIYTTAPEKLRKKIEHARFVTTCTAHNEKYLKNIAGTNAASIFCIYHGIDTNLFKHQQSKINTVSPYHLLTVARMTEKKGLPTLYRALKILKSSGFPFHHTLIGDGDDREKILNMISSLGLDDCCEWLGTRTHKEVLQQFNKTDLFVLACEIAKSGDRDGIPNVLVESLAMGVPALSTEVSAIPEILLNGKTGITVPPSQPETMSAAIIRMLTDHDLRQRLITNGRRYVEEGFDNKIWVKKLGRLFLSQNSSLETRPVKPE